MKNTYQQFLMKMLKTASKKTLKENVQPKARTQKTVITGNKPVHVSPETTDAQAEIINLRKLAGI